MIAIVDYERTSPSRDKARRILELIRKEIRNEKIFDEKRNELEDKIASIISEGMIEDTGK